MTNFVWNTLSEGREWTKTFAHTLRRPTVVLLDGPLGSGKTQFVKWCVVELGGGERDVVSPTFAIHQSYACTAGAVDHLDLYRLTSDVDLESTGFWDLLREPKALLFIEWAARLPDSVFPQSFTRVHLEFAEFDPAGELRRGRVSL